MINKKDRLAVSGLGYLISLGVSCISVAEEKSQFLEEVTVTAQKRDESLQSVPMSIKALTERELSRLGVTSMADLVYRVPSLSFRSTGPGRQKITMRGISSAAGASTVSFYVNESPITASSSATGSSFQQVSADPNLFDVERVEVLRGPQGTLYGASSMGGAIRVITRQPDNEQFAGSFNIQSSVTQDGGVNWSGDGMLNIPLVQDKVALRLVGTHKQYDGFVDRLIGNFDHDGRIEGPGNELVSFPSRTAEPGEVVRRIKDVNTEDITQLRATIDAKISDSLYVKPSIFYQSTEQDGKAKYDSVPGQLDQRRAFDIEEPYEDDLLMFNFELGYSFDSMDLLSSSTFFERELESAEDMTDLMSYFWGYANGAGDLPGAQRVIDATGALWDLTTAPFPASVQAYPSIARQFNEVTDYTQEFRLTSSNEGPLQWIAGLYYKHSEADIGYDFTVPGYSATFPVYSIIFGSLGFSDTLAKTQGKNEFTEIAVFGEVNYQLTDRVNLLLGARFFDYETDLVRESIGLFFGSPVPLTTETNANDSGVSPKVLVGYDINEDTNFYVTAAKGYRPGAGNAPIPTDRCAADLAALGISEAPSSYGPDEVWNYELGLKSEFNEGRGTLNVALYQIDWSDVQQLLLLPICGGTFIDNAGEAQSRGLEVEFDVLLSDSFRLAGGAGYVDAEFVEDTPAAGVQDGDTLLDAPQWTANLMGEYSFDLFGENDAYIRLVWSYVDDSLDVKDRVKESFEFLDFRAGVELENWKIGLFINNLNNEKPNYTSVDVIGAIWPTFARVSTARPRTAGLSITRSF